MDGGAQTIYKGTLVSNDTSGYAVSGSDTASEICIGVSVEKKTIASEETDGTTKIKVYRDGLFLFAFSGGDAAVTDVGSLVYIKDDNTVGLVADVSNSVCCGKLAMLESSSEVWVDIADRSATA